jgi:short-subunit dehydrogenase
MTTNKKVILITGASAGLGKDFAHRLLDEGYEVIAVARRVENMSDLKEKGATTLKMDITIEEDIINVVETVKRKFSRVDILINNAGYAEQGAVETIDQEIAKRQFEVNLFGLASLTQKVIPMMREQGSGKIINISSIAGKLFVYLGAWYTASKHALEGWSDSMRLELAPFGIDVVMIQPGVIKTEFNDVSTASMVERAKGTIYEKMTDVVTRTMESPKVKEQGSEPKVITDLVMKAIKAKKPKRRYVGGAYAKPLLFIRRWFGDAVYEKAIMSLYSK